jgi:hypothetical protein
MANPFGTMQDHIHFEWREVAIALVKAKGIHRGLWRAGLWIESSALLANVTAPSGGQVTKCPAALVTIPRVNIKQMKPDEADELTIDAAKENPRPLLIHSAVN